MVKDVKNDVKDVKPIKERDENIWTDECEALLAEWSEKASCYRWLHGRCEKSYRTWYYCFSIPVIILSTLTGAANVGMDSFVPPESKSMASAIVGGVNIFAGIVSTLQNFLKVAELMEGHRIAGVSWGKLQRNISIELTLNPNRRVLQTDFLKLSRSEYDRLIEAGPIVDDGIINQFNKKFKNYEVSKPSICNGLDKCKIYKIDKTIKMDTVKFEEGIEDVILEEEKKPINQPLQIKVDELDMKDFDKNNKLIDSKKEDFVNEVEEDIVKETIIPKNISVDITEIQEQEVIETNEKDTQTEDELMSDFLDGIKEVEEKDEGKDNKTE